MQHKHGFTIVELLIVIVVIAILAAITIVAFNGIQDRARYSAMQSDFEKLHKALEMYKVDHGAYPNSDDCEAEALPGGGFTASYENEWCGWSQSSNNSFIPGIAPKYIERAANLAKNDDKYNTYLYKSAETTDGITRGTKYYELIRFKRSGLSDVEASEAPLITDPSYTVDGKPTAWGIKSDPNLPWW